MTLESVEAKKKIWAPYWVAIYRDFFVCNAARRKNTEADVTSASLKRLYKLKKKPKKISRKNS